MHDETVKKTLMGSTSKLKGRP